MLLHSRVQKPELYIYLLSCIILSEFTSPYFAGIHNVMDIQVSLSLHRVHEMLVHTPDHSAGCIASSWTQYIHCWSKFIDWFGEQHNIILCCCSPIM